MSTNMPTSVDTFPAAATLAAHTLGTDPHSTLHGNLGDALAATEALAIAAVSKTGGGKETLSTNATATGAVSVDLANGNVHKHTLTGNATYTFTGSTASVSCSFTLIAIQDGSGSHTIAWPASVKWAGGTAPTISTGAGKVDIFSFITVDNGTTWYGATAGIDFR